MDNDQQQRLARILDWMRDHGDPWLQDGRNGQPEPGSDLARDDAEGPASSPLSHRVLVMALDHLGFVVDAVWGGPPKRLNAPFSALRTALECGARARWLLEADCSTERRLRGLRYRYQNLEEKRKAITAMSGTHMIDEQDDARAQVLVQIAAEKTSLTERAAALGADRLKEPPNTLNMLTSMVDVNTYFGTGVIQLWRQGSASVHGHYWVDDMRGNTGAFDSEWFHIAIQGAMLFVNDALKMHERRRVIA
ncbi:hypothetical protein P3H80_21025 [Mycolicibacterium septicum]|uniref:hypothetical protein n=1 Tax=Mycolicibacterium septicum TaxID=98668 RepID=UPI0023E0F41E|nr:hypothetical protein [Mycolicibacterium septicum]MDF3339933.1 hypothetical protein [Mycolicibacterium septicum]